MKGLRKKIGLRSVLFVTMFFLSFSLLFSQEKTKFESREELSKKIEQLRTIIQDQQKQIDTLKDEMEIIKKERAVVTLPSVPELKDFSERLPKGAKPFKYNGQTYYIIPLNNIDGIEDDVLKKQ